MKKPTAAEIESQVMSELADKALTTRGIIRRVCELAGLKVVDNGKRLCNTKD